MRVVGPATAAFVIVLGVAVLPWSGLAGTALLVGAIGGVVASHVLHRDAVTLLTALVAVLFGISARLVIGPLGAVGQPTIVLGLLLGWIWIHGHAVSSLGLAGGRNPVRLTAMFMAWMTLFSYAIAHLHPLSPVVSSSTDRVLISTLAMISIALFAADGIADRQRLEKLLARIVAGGALLAVIGIVQFTTGFDPVARFRIPGLRLHGGLETIGVRSTFRRVSGTAAHGIEFGVIIAMLLPLGVHFAMHAPKGRRGLNWLIVGVLGAAIPMSVSRSSVVALVVGLGVLSLGWTWRQRRRAILLMTVFVFGMRSAVPGLLGTIRSLFTHWNDDPSIAGRTNDFAVVSGWIAESPWVGQGLGTLVPTETLFLDNQFLGTLVEGGILGLMILMALFLVPLSVLLRQYRRSPMASEARHLHLALVAALGVELVSFSTFDALGFRMNATLMFLLIGCAGALWRITEFETVHSLSDIRQRRRMA